MYVLRAYLLEIIYADSLELWKDICKVSLFITTLMSDYYYNTLPSIL
jgi:hypothetical protein